MPIIKPDLSELDNPIEAGTYKAKLETVVPKLSKNNTPMLEIDVEVNVDGKARARKTWVMTSGKAAFQFEQLLRATNFGDIANRLKAGEEVEFDTDELIDQEVEVVIEPDEYNGQPTDKITKFLRV